MGVWQKPLAEIAQEHVTLQETNVSHMKAFPVAFFIVGLRQGSTGLTDVKIETVYSAKTFLKSNHK